MWQEFKAFIMCGSVVALAVGIIIGAAFGRIVSSLVDVWGNTVFEWRGGLSYET